MPRKGIVQHKGWIAACGCDSLWIESGKVTKILATSSATSSHFIVLQGCFAGSYGNRGQPTRPLSIEPSQGPPSHVPTTSARAQMWGAQGDQPPYPFMSSVWQASYSKAWCHMRLSCRAAASLRAAFHVQGISHKSPGKPASSRVANQVYLVRVTFLACLVNGGLHTMQVPSIAWVNC